MMTQQIDDPMIPVPIPQQVPAKEGMAELPGTRLGYWDTGGDGTPVVFLHPASGSALVWLYQQPVFAKAGYRVIAYSRRNHYNSDLAAEDNPGIGSEDLHNLIELLGVKRFHAVSSAAGGSVATDYAFSHPERLLSLTVSSNNLAARNGYIAETAAMIRPKETESLPRWYWELGPSIPRCQPRGRRAMEGAQPQVRDRQGSPAEGSQRSYAGKAGDLKSSGAADRWRGRPGNPPVYHADDRAPCPRQRGRGGSRVRAFVLLGAPRVLQPHGPRIHRPACKISKRRRH